ncbi:glycoside hydrolase family 3 protein [Paenibacillus oenotherae]|nr:glycoside hydrolase family 3 N-terminal domain-containing protein [Paenibacillus oenotherae]
MFVLLLICCLSGCSNSKGNTAPPEAGAPGAGQAPSGNSPPVHEPEAGLQDALKGMTLDEKLGQLVIAGIEGKTPSGRMKEMILGQHVGGIIFFKDNLSARPREVTALVNQLKAWNRLNPAAPPLLFSVDQEGGRVSRLPGVEALPAAHAIGARNDAGFAAWIGSTLGKMCRSMGMNMDYAPVLDINSNPDNPVIGSRSFGTTAELVTRMGLKEIAGLREQGVIPVVKHFPGHGDTGVDSHLDLPVVRKGVEELRALEWVPFIEAIREGVDAVMVGHLLLPEIDSKQPASLSRLMITGQLRGALDFKGVIITDDMTMGAISKHYGIGDAAVLTIKAGGDLVMVAHKYDNVAAVLGALKQSVENGEISEERIDESVGRILKLKNKYRLTDDPTPSPDKELARLNQAIRKKLAVMGITQGQSYPGAPRELGTVNDNKGLSEKSNIQ